MRAIHARGFTLVELMVAMSAGLIVAMAVVGLSHEASNTFHEETRMAATEMQLRTGIDRLRADVERAAFMSTGNIFIDPMVLTAPGTTTNVNGGVYGGTPTAYQSASHMSLYDLAGVRLFPGGSNLPSMPLSAANYGPAPLGPDAIEIGGNLTGVEVLAIGAPAASGSTPGLTSIVAGGACGTQRIYLDVQSSPALWRLVGMSPTGNDVLYNTQLLNAFEPVNPANNAGTGAAFIVRIVDNNTNKVQYAATCPAAAATWAVPSGVPTPYVDLDKNSFVTTTGIQQNWTINPVHIVRWQLTPSTILAPGESNTVKYDLTRQFVDAYGNLAGTPEVVAEYAVDLKFAFTIDTLGNTLGTYTGLATSPLVVNTFEDTSASNAIVTNAIVAGDVSGSTPTGGSAIAGPYPQRIRSVRMRVVTRSALQDRTTALDAGSPYLYRYTLATGSYARTRTIISEVSIPNQARLWFQ